MKGTVFPDVVTDEDGKYPHAAPALRQRLQLQSLMNSGLVSTVTLTAPHKQLPVTRVSSASANFTDFIMPRAMAAIERVCISRSLPAPGPEPAARRNPK